MLKQILSFFVIIALSAAVVFFMPEAQKIIQLLISGHDWVAGVLSSVFSDSHAGNIARELVALLIIPFLIGLFPAVVFFLIRKHWLSCFMDIVWIVWLLQAGAMLMVFTYPAESSQQPAVESTQKAPEPEAAPPAAAEPKDEVPANEATPQ